MARHGINGGRSLARRLADAAETQYRFLAFSSLVTFCGLSGAGARTLSLFCKCGDKHPWRAEERSYSPHRVPRDLNPRSVCETASLNWLHFPVVVIIYGS